MKHLARVFLGPVVLAGGLVLAPAPLLAGGTITKSSECTKLDAGAKHAVATLFFGPNLRNVVATNNEYLEMDGFPFESKPTDIHFNVYLANGASAGKCLGSIKVHIDANTNESVQFAIEGYIPKVDGERIGLIERTGSLGKRKKFDIYVDVMDGGKRGVIWNNFIGLPNQSREMSPMRFLAGQHLLINYSGDNPAGAEARIQVFRNDGTFVGVAMEKVGPHSVTVTDSVRTLAYKDLKGTPVDVGKLPPDGGGYIKVQGLNATEALRATGNLFKAVTPNSMDGKKFRHSDLVRATITWSRRNAGLGGLKIGQ